MLPYLVEDALRRGRRRLVREAAEGGDHAGRAHHVVPRRDDGFHVEIAREEGDDAVWDNLAVFDQDATKVAYHRRVVAYFEPRADGHLVATAGNDLSYQGIRMSGHEVLWRDMHGPQGCGSPVARTNFA